MECYGYIQCELGLTRGECGLRIGQRQTCLYVGRDEHVSLYGGR
jgi:hypothetical protein